MIPIMNRMLKAILCVHLAYAYVINNVRLLKNPDFDAITEEDMRLVSATQNITYLNISTLKPAFPVHGVIMATYDRYMINMLVRRKSVTDTPYRNIMFMIDTSSPYTFLAKSAMQAMLGTKEKFPDYLNIEIHGEPSLVCYSSDVNLLGLDFLRKHSVQIYTNWPHDTFSLYNVSTLQPIACIQTTPPPPLPPFAADFIITKSQIRLACNCSQP